MHQSAQEKKKRKALLIPRNSNGETLIQDRRGHKLPDWGFWGGGIDGDETPLEAVIRETKEELNIALTANDLVLLGEHSTIFGEVEVERHFFLYRTDQRNFDVFEGAGAHWCSDDEARQKLMSEDHFDEILTMIKNLNRQQKRSG